MTPRYVVLDRDGTLIEERNYLSDPAQVVLLPCAAAGLRHLQQLGLELIVATNQSGVARGYFSLEQVDAVHQRLRELLAAEGVQLADFFVCPHAPDDGCRCRKPSPGMVERAAARFGFDPAQCYVIGDKKCDIDLGRGVGAVSILVRTGYGHLEEIRPDVRSDYVVDHLQQAALLIDRLLAGPVA